MILKNIIHFMMGIAIGTNLIPALKGDVLAIFVVIVITISNFCIMIKGKI